MQSYNPTYAVTYVVWAFSRSLAATWEIIIIFFSSAYLDVSVQRVSQNCPDKSGGFPHSEIMESKVLDTSSMLIAA
jgi:hypothetical protein